MNAPRFRDKTKQLTAVVMDVINAAQKPLKKTEIAELTGISIKKMNSLTNTWKDASKRTKDPSFPRLVGSHWWGTLAMQNLATRMGWSHGRGTGNTGWTQRHVDTLFLDNNPKTYAPAVLGRPKAGVADRRERVVKRYKRRSNIVVKETRDDHLMEARRMCDRALDVLPRNRETMLAYHAIVEALIKIDRAIHD